jgi:hypothetical protein
VGGSLVGQAAADQQNESKAESGEHQSSSDQRVLEGQDRERDAKALCGGDRMKAVSRMSAYARAEDHLSKRTTHGAIGG